LAPLWNEDIFHIYHIHFSRQNEPISVKLLYRILAFQRGLGCLATRELSPKQALLA
jgi:hypothetical protein